MGQKALVVVVRHLRRAGTGVLALAQVRFAVLGIGRRPGPEALLRPPRPGAR